MKRLGPCFLVIVAAAVCSCGDDTSSSNVLVGQGGSAPDASVGGTAGAGGAGGLGGKAGTSGSGGAGGASKGGSGGSAAGAGGTATGGVAGSAGTAGSEVGSAGTAGTGGIDAGLGGAAGEAGSAGDSGSAGDGGSAGVAGSAGNGGAAGDGGSAGTGTGGVAGSAGAAGDAGTAGSAGSCVATTCAAESKDCGSIPDGCGVMLPCGTCTGFKTCGGGGVANVCGGHTEPVTPVCTSDNWCWDNPLPQGNLLHGAATLQAGDNWVVGNGGTVLHWDGAMWTGKAAITPNRLNAVRAFANDDVWVVGDAGTILHWNGTTWSPSVSSSTKELFGIWGATTNELWAVGAGGTVLGWNGTQWAAATVSTTADLKGIWGASAGDIWAVGAQAILHWNGAAWSVTTTTADLSSVWGTTSTNVWAVGTSTGSLRRWNGAAWNTSTSSVAGSAMYGTAANDIWVVNTQLETFHFNGSAWSSSAIASGGWHVGMYGITGAPNGDLLAVGDDGVMYRRTEGAWHLATQGILELLPQRIQFGNLSAASATDVFAAGFQYSSSLLPDQGYVMKRSATGWKTDFDQAPPNYVDGISADSATDAWAVAYSAKKVLHYDGASWSVSNSLANAPLIDVKAISPTNVWAVGKDRTFHWDGAAWSDIPNPVNVTTVSLSVVDASASDNVWAGGTNGTAMKWNGTDWAAIPTNTTLKIGCLSVASPSRAMACTSAGLLVWDGTTWAPDNSLAGYTIYAVKVLSATDAWAIAGKDWEEFIFHWNGSSWQESGTGLTHDLILRDIDSRDGTQWILGEGGRILRH